jgi:hypothetical protein
MASEAQIRANKLNSQHSTGPRTAAGKQASRSNAIKHGLAARMLVLPTESDVEYHELRGALLTEFDPQSPSEMFLVDQIAQNWWRLNRSRRYETGMLSKLDAENGEAPTHTDFDLHRRYEAAIERAYYRAYDRMDRIKRRRPEPVPVVQQTHDDVGNEAAEPANAAEPITLVTAPQPIDSTAQTAIGFVSYIDHAPVPVPAPALPDDLPKCA